MSLWSSITSSVSNLFTPKSSTPILPSTINNMSMVPKSYTPPQPIEKSTFNKLTDIFYKPLTAVSSLIGGPSELSTTSKNIGLIGGSAIVGAPVATMSLLSSATSTIGKQATQHPIQTFIAGTVGIPTVLGVIAEKPSLLTSLPQTAYEGGKKLVNVIEEHPIASAIVGSVGGGVALYEAGKAIGIFDDKNNNTITPNYAVMTQTTPTAEQEEVSLTPSIEPQQQDIMPSVPRKKRKKLIKPAPTQTQSQRMNVQINNVELSGRTKKYIKVANY